MTKAVVDNEPSDDYDNIIVGNILSHFFLI